MALVLKQLYRSYHWLFNEFKDARVENFALIGSPFPIIGLIGIYIYFVTIWGQKWMENRKAFDLKRIINIYDLFQIFANLYIGIIGSYYAFWRGTLKLTCQPLDTTVKTYDMEMVLAVTHFYYIIKIIDLLDTVFFVLRKKNNQISFLHVYHHAGMVAASYVHNKFLSGSHGTLLGVLNAYVHVIMYTYYFLTSVKPELDLRAYKIHITHLQLVQFGILVVHFLNPILFYDCAFPTAIAVIGAIQNLFMFILFLDFYLKAYVKKRKTNRE